MDLAYYAAEIARNVGREFPDPLVPWQEMTLRQLLSLVEEAIELDEALRSGTSDQIAGELADAAITPYLVAHYADIDLDQVELEIPGLMLAPPYREAGKVVKAGRRFLGIARRRGTKDELAMALARLSFSVQLTATANGVDLETAITDKLNIIFSRGWKEEATNVLG